MREHVKSVGDLGFGKDVVERGRVRKGFGNPVGGVEFDVGKERAEVGEIAKDSEGKTVMLVNLKVA